MPSPIRLAAACVTTLLLVACATAPADGEAVTAGLDKPEASIAFANQSATIREWQADGTAGIWVQDAHRNWYYGRFHSSCFGLEFAEAVGFQVGSTGRLDRFSSIVVPREGRCALRSFVASDAPPDNGQRRKGDPPQQPATQP